ncbi:MAG TPA: thiamine phosphate synthase [Verrucomicrobiota bacterium]|nr:thiamine phosphate synthase [Verrucomicrobiota bacterium]HNU49389.1 thiamine phosphate synthase [Verrucomicrobiota bacterium]
MRIAGGHAGGRRLQVPKGLAVRPTPDRVKQAVFNSLGSRVAGAHVLELFAGSGALSIECLSRGAASVVAVEKSPRHAAFIRRNADAAGFSRPAFELRTQDVFAVLGQLRAAGRSFDLILADPPFGEKNLGRRSESMSQRLLDDPDLRSLLGSDGWLVLGHARRDTLSVPEGWSEARCLRHGDSVFRLMQWRAPSSGETGAPGGRPPESSPCGTRSQQVKLGPSGSGPSLVPSGTRHERGVGQRAESSSRVVMSPRTRLGPGRVSLAECRLYAFVDTAYLRGRDAVDVATQLCEGGADLIQLRAKGEPVEAVRRLAERLVEVTRRHGVWLVVNDHPDVALAAGAPLCHLGQEDFFDAGHRHVSELSGSVGQAGDPAGAGGGCLRIGLSTHAPEQALRAVSAGAAYVAIGPVFATPTKPGAQPVTLDYVRWAAATLRVPWFAIGGITLETLDAVIEAGARRVGVVSAILNRPDVARACHEFRCRLLSAGKMEHDA